MTEEVGVEYRQLSRRQAAELRGYLAVSTIAFRAIVFVVAVGLAAFALRTMLKAAASFGPALSHPAWWALPTCALSLWLYRRSSRWTGGHAFRAQVRQDLARGRLAVRKVEAVDAVAFEEVEDCGPGYIILTQDGRTLLFDGQYLDAYKRRGFPWKSFEIREGPESAVFFGLRRLGDRLPVAAELPGLSFAERKGLGSFNKPYQNVEVDFQALKARGRRTRG